MLNQLQTIIAFAVVMLGMSLVITAITQVVSTFLASRGLNLHWALTNLFEELRPELKTRVKQAEGKQGPTLGSVVVDKILLHPLISDSSYSGKLELLKKYWNRAKAIRYEELLRVLDLISEGERPVGSPLDTWKSSQLAGWLVGDPRLSREWFDTAMDRASQRFATHMRAITIVCTFIVAFGAHFDSLELYREVSGNTELRSNLEARAASMMTRYEQTLATEQLSADQNKDQLKARFEAAKSQVQSLQNELGSAGLELFPSPYSRHLTRGGCINPWNWGFVARPFGIDTEAAACQDFLPWIRFSHFIGVLLSSVLLSLGAPFWYNLLRSLTNLKPIVAGKEETERKQQKSDETVSFKDLEK